MRVTMQVVGAKEVARALERFGDLVEEWVEAALDESAEAVRESARGRVDGSLSDRIRVRRRGRLDTGVEAQDYRARFREFGTAPHKIKPRRKKALRFAPGGDEVFAAEVNHPGQPARPFLVPAAEQERGRFERRVSDAVDRAAREVAE